jgi:hypothetical protein
MTGTSFYEDGGVQELGRVNLQSRPCFTAALISVKELKCQESNT